MALFYPDEGLIDTLDVLTAAQTITIHLIAAVYATFPSMTAAALTEATYPGYAPQIASGWSPAALSAGQAKSQADPLVFTRSSGAGGDQIYGYYGTDGPTGPLIMVSPPLSVPIPLLVAGQNLAVIPRRSLGPC